MLKEIVPDSQDLDGSDRNTPFQPYPQVPAVSHVADTAPPPGLTPARHQWVGRLPFAPWRFMVLAAIIIAAIPCGIAAAAPGINGAELALGVLLAFFVTVFLISGEDA